MKVLSTIQRSTHAITLMAILGLVSFSALIQLNSKKVSELRLFQEGIQTCFSRVAQTFTARTIGDLNSTYIANDFKGFTEECFGEAMVAFEDIKSFKSDEILAETNKINTEVYQLHKKITATVPLNTPENVLIANIGSRFEKLEIKRDNVLTLVDNSLQNLSEKRKDLKTFFYFFAIITPFLILLSLLKNISKEKRFQKIENNASELLKDENFHVSKVEDLIGSTLREFEFENMKQLFDTYLARKGSLQHSDSVGQSTFVNSKIDLEEQISQVWNEAKTSPEKTVKTKKNPDALEKKELTNLEESVGVVVDSLAEKLFIMGVNVDINVRKTLAIISKEDLDQIIYHALTALIQDSDKKARNRSLNIFLKNNGNTSHLNMTYSGSLEVNLDNRVELSICKQLLEDNGGSLTTNHRKSSFGTTRVFNLEFKRSSKSKLVDIKKTTKKDWIESVRFNA